MAVRPGQGWANGPGATCSSRAIRFRGRTRRAGRNGDPACWATEAPSRGKAGPPGTAGHGHAVRGEHVALVGVRGERGDRDHDEQGRPPGRDRAVERDDERHEPGPGEEDAEQDARPAVEGVLVRGEDEPAHREQRRRHGDHRPPFQPTRRSRPSVRFRPGRQEVRAQGARQRPQRPRQPSHGPFPRPSPRAPRRPSPSPRSTTCTLRPGDPAGVVAARPGGAPFPYGGAPGPRPARLIAAERRPADQ